MAERLRWWVIPGAIIVLARVVTLDDGTGRQPEAAPVAAPAPLDETAAGPVVLRDASGRRSAPVPCPADAANALLVQLPVACAGQRVQLTLWRRLGNGREALPWLTATPRVRSDAVLPIAGQPAGSYDVEVMTQEGAAAAARTATDVVVPGRVDLSGTH